MNTPLRVSAAALICLGVATACVRTTEGDVAMTTEPGGPLTTTTRTTTRTTTPTTTTPRTTTSGSPTTSPGAPPTSPTSAVPAPANALTMKCSEFIELDQATRLAVVKEILANEESSFGVLGEEFAESIANTMCQFMKESTVREVLSGSPPP